MDMSAWEVRGGLRQRYGGHVMCLQFIPVRSIVQQRSLQLNQDLSDGTVTDESSKRADRKHFEESVINVVSSKCHGLRLSACGRLY